MKFIYSEMVQMFREMCINTNNTVLRGVSLIIFLPHIRTGSIKIISDWAFANHMQISHFLIDDKRVLHECILPSRHFLSGVIYGR